MSSAEDDLLKGTKAIAAYLGWNERRVTYLREQRTNCPIRKRLGVGLYAFKSELNDWLHAPETLPNWTAKATLPTDTINGQH